MMTKKASVSALAILAMALGASAPARAGVVYQNGPYGGNTVARVISNTYEVTNSFVVSTSATLTSAEVLLWVLGGATPTTVDWRIGTSQYDDDVASGTATPTNAYFGVGGGGYYDIYSSTLAIGGAVTSGVTYWFTLNNATATQSSAVFWDESGGPSLAEQRWSGGVIPPPIRSESFRLHGDVAAVPEPASLSLLGLGCAAVLAIHRRRKATIA